MINKEHFLTNYPFRPLTQTQVDNLNFLLSKLDASESITRLSEYAYIFATLKLETADTFAPVQEAYWLKPESRRISVLKNMYAGRQSIINPNGRLYYGRGYVQLTHIDNYIKMNAYIKAKFPEADIVSDPDSVCDPEYSWIVLEQGMSRGLFTGKKLSHYFNDDGRDFYHARKIINGLDRAGLVSQYAEKYFDVLEWIGEAKAVGGTDNESPGSEKGDKA